MDAPAGLHVLSNRSSYPITGSTAAALRGAIRLLGPTRGDRTYGAFTDWRIDWWFAFAEVGAGVRVSSARVELHTRVLLPRWRPPRSASEALKVEWGRYLAAVETHEQGHVDIAVEAAKVLLQKLERLEGCGDLPALRAAANETAREVIAAAHEQEWTYDAGSEHGVGQGAWLSDGESDAGASRTWMEGASQ
jgi:predicted secreted Zn-dependent protease